MTFVTGGEGELKEIFLTDEKLLEDLIGDRLWLAGYNAYGQIGDSSILNKSNLTQTVSTQLNWVNANAGDFSAGIKSDGTLWTWGRNNYGQLGDETVSNKSSPVQTKAVGTTWKQLSCGDTHMAAIKTDGRLWIWGRNNRGQLGDNTIIHKSSPIQTLASGDTWKEVACGREHTAAIKIDGTLWMWGFNTSGQLGDNSLISKSSAVQTSAGGTNWKQVSCGSDYTMAIKEDGTLWGWGLNSNGQLALNTTTSTSNPLQEYTTSVNWKQVSCGHDHVAAIKIDGTLWCWGDNTVGSLGDNSLIKRSSPVQTVGSGAIWKSASAGYKHTAAIKTDGTLWTWGNNTQGPLGTNDLVHRSSPTQTSLAGENWKNTNAGKNIICAITNGG